MYLFIFIIDSNSKADDFDDDKDTLAYLAVHSGDSAMWQRCPSLGSSFIGTLCAVLDENAIVNTEVNGLLTEVTERLSVEDAVGVRVNLLSCSLTKRLHLKCELKEEEEEEEEVPQKSVILRLEGRNDYDGFV